MPEQSRPTGVSLRQAAVIAGLAYLLNPVTYAEYVYPDLVVAGNVEQTVANIYAHPLQFLLVFGCYALSFIGDIVLAWALYLLLAPVNRGLSLLAAIFQLVYAAIALVAALNLLTAFHALVSPSTMTAFGVGPLHAQVHLLLETFRSQWGFSLMLFGVHLVLVGYLVMRSRHVPRWIGAWLLLDGVGWMIGSVQPYLFPDAPLGFLAVGYVAEVVFMLWLLIRGWKVTEL